MADLPVCRVSSFSRPFQFTGVDYFGPMSVKRGRSVVKKWGCLFTCLVTRAIHLELADSLETDDFIMVLRCFIARRGTPEEIWSDNGTNFKGANRELEQQLEQWNQVKIHDHLLQNHIKWNFIPPQAPHFGGAWERLVRSVKVALKVVLKEQLVVESVLRTALAEVEAVVNSRPLTYNSTDPGDFSAVTPNHFLHIGCTKASSPGEFDKADFCSRKRWRQAEIISDHLWRRWLAEYLPNLTLRAKWYKTQNALKVNDLVLVIEDNYPRGQWQLGRVTEILPGTDGVVRAVKVKTPTGVYTRPATKICLLEESTV